MDCFKNQTTIILINIISLRNSVERFTNSKKTHLNRICGSSIVFCQSMGCQPLCTCTNCMGKHAHFTQFPATSAALPSADPVLISETVTSTVPGKRKMDDMKLEQSLQPNRITGTACVIDGVKRKAPGIPIIQIGKYRKLILCKKGHLSESEDSNLLLRVLENEVNHVNNVGDENMKKIGLEDSPKDDDDSKEENEDNDESEVCSGLSVLPKKGEDIEMKCGAKCSKVLHCNHGGETYYFCSARHLLRWLIFYHLGQGHGGARKKSKGNSKASAKTRQKDESEEEEEEKKASAEKQNSKKGSKKVKRRGSFDF